MVTQGSTREALRKSVGHALGVMRELTADASGSTTTFLTDDLAIMTADDLNGKWLIFTSGQSNIDEQIAQITDSTVSSNQVTLTFYPAVTNAPVANATAEMWDQPYRPIWVHNALNQAVLDATGAIFEPTTDISLHTGSTKRYSLAGTLDMVKEVWLRTGMDSQQILEAGNVWDESVQSDWTISQDDEARLYGRVSTKFDVAATASNGDLASQDIPILDLSRYTHFECPIRVAGTSAITAIVASDLLFILSATANGTDTDKLIAIPALTVGKETWVRVAMDESTSTFSPDQLTAIISAGIEYNANIGANVFWTGRMEATREDSYEWTLVANHLWYIDKNNQELVFKPEVNLGYRLMKLVGGDNPTQLTTDTDVTEIPERYMVHYAVGMLLQRYIPGESAEQAGVREHQADRQMGMAEAAKRAFPMLSNARFSN